MIGVTRGPAEPPYEGIDMLKGIARTVLAVGLVAASWAVMLAAPASSSSTAGSRAAAVAEARSK